MNTSDLHYFTLIGSSSSWEEAAKKSEQPPSELLTCIHRLEEELHFSLLVSPDSLQLTEKGLDLLNHARIIDHEMAQIYEISKEKEPEPSPILICMKTCHLLVAHILNGFHNAFPDIKLDFNIALTPEHEQESRFTISAEKELPEGDGKILLMKEPIDVEISPSHSLAKHDALRLADLTDQPFISQEPGTKMRSIIDEYFQEEGFTPHTILHSISDIISWDLISSGTAVGLVPSIIEKLVKPKNLQLIPLTDPPMCRYIVLYWDSSKPLTKTEQCVMQYLISFFYDLQNRTPSFSTKSRVFAHTFGSFDLYLDGKPIYFSNKKSKELLAIMVNSKGSSVSMEQAIDLLWEDEPYGDNIKRRYRNAVICLRQTLEKHDLQHLVTFQRAYSNVNTEHFLCDLYEFLNGSDKYIQSFSGEYMSNYSWGEYTLGMLETIKNKIH